MESQGLVKILPSKGVFILKPPSWSDEKFWGEEEAMSLYAGGASAETFRMIAYATERQWTGATSDVTGPFYLQIGQSPSQSTPCTLRRSCWKVDICQARRGLVGASPAVRRKGGASCSKRMAGARIFFKGGQSI